MNILALDTATEKLSVALGTGRDTLLFEASGGVRGATMLRSTAALRSATMLRSTAAPRHSELLMDCIDLLMQKAGLKPEELTGIVCTGGPGSFTGLRIGFALAKGLALSLGIPFAPIPTLDCMAQPFSSWPGITVPVIDAKKSAFFCAFYRNGQKLCPDMDAAPDAILKMGNKEPMLLIGPGAELLYEKLPAAENIIPGSALRYGNAETLLEMAAAADIFASSNSSLFAGPEYIRKSDAEIQMNK